MTIRHVFLIIFIFVVPACSKTTAPTAAMSAQKILYHCAMHPQIISDHPGECPICHMNLVRFEPAESSRGTTAPGVVMLSQGIAQHLGVTVARADYRLLSTPIRAAAKVAYDPGLYAASIEHAEALSFLKRAQAQNSPELLEQAQATVRASTLRLRQMGVSGEDLGESSLLLGSAHGRLWVYASISDVDAALVHAGLSAELTSPAVPGEIFKGTVYSVDPILNSETRTLRVRIAVNNTRGLLKPEMYLSATLYAVLGRRLVVPENAVLDTGTRQLVYVELSSGTYMPREVRVGLHAEGYQEIISGLTAGEKVATSANFLIDSESRIQAATSKAMADQ